MKKRIFASILVITIISAMLISCSAKSIGIIGGSDGPTAILVSSDREEQNIEKLYDFKTDYVGDNSKVGNILVASDRLFEMPFNNFERTYQITGNNGVIINYSVDDRGNYPNLDYFHFDKIAATLFGLIGNLEEVYFRIYDEYSDKENPDTAFFGCAYFIETLSQRQVTKEFTEEKMRSAAENIESFKEYMNEVLAIEFPETVKSAQKKAVEEYLGETEEIVTNSLAIFEIEINEEVLETELAAYMPESVDLKENKGKTLEFHLYAIRDYAEQYITQHIFVFRGNKLLGAREFLDEKEAYQATQQLVKLTEGASE